MGAPRTTAGAGKTSSTSGPSAAASSSTLDVGANSYASTVATQSDIAKYRGKYKELKTKVREVELENDEIHLKTLNLKRTIQRLRLERA